MGQFTRQLLTWGAIVTTTAVLPGLALADSLSPDHKGGRHGRGRLPDRRRPRRVQPEIGPRPPDRPATRPVRRRRGLRPAPAKLKAMQLGLPVVERLDDLPEEETIVLVLEDLGDTGRDMSIPMPQATETRRTILEALVNQTGYGLTSGLESLDERVRPRLASGLCVEMGALDEALRVKILETRIAAARVAQPTFEVHGMLGGYTGSGDFIKTGNGELILTGNSTHTGNTVVRGGTLTITSEVGKGSCFKLSFPANRWRQSF